METKEVTIEGQNFTIKELSWGDQLKLNDNWSSKKYMELSVVGGVDFDEMKRDIGEQLLQKINELNYPKMEGEKGFQDKDMKEEKTTGESTS